MDIKKILASFLSASFCIFSAFSYANASDEAQLLLGDADLNGTIDSVDASLILVEYSASSTGGTSTLNSTQKKCADVDRNSTIDSVDASHVLAYYAYISTGGKSNIVDFLDGEYEPAATTTTTKQPETTTTQAPVIEECLENIIIDAGLFEWYSGCLMDDTMQGNYIITDYKEYVFGGVENDVLLAMLNMDEGFSEDVIYEVFRIYSDDEIRDSIKYMYMYAFIISAIGSDPDYTEYTINKNIGNYLNQLIDAQQSDNIENVLYDSFENGMIPEECLNNPGVMSILCSYDKNKTYLNSETYDDTYVYEFVENIIKIKNGKAYTS